MRIIHFSDIHLHNKDISNINVNFIDPFINDLKKKNSQKKIDIILFSGDLVDQGGRSFSDIELAFLSFKEYIMDPILNALNLEQSKFLIVPGNHDIDRSKVDIYSEPGLISSLNSLESVNDFIESENLHHIKRVLDFKNFEKQLYENSAESITNFTSVFKHNIGGKSVGILCINSAWRCNDSSRDKGMILIGERQLKQSIYQIKDCDIKIAMLHHPLDWLASVEFKVISQILQKEFDMMFCGHVHESQTELKATMLGKLLVAIAPSNWIDNSGSDSRTYSNGYTVIDYENEIKLEHRRYSNNKNCYVANTDLGNDEGCDIFPIPSSEDQEIMQELRNYCRGIEEIHLESRNEHLLSFKTNTIAPKNIIELFVLPELKSHEQYDIEDKDGEEVYGLQSIVNMKENLILLGPQESGKTILLDRLLIEFINRNIELNTIPVFIDFKENKNTKIKTSISRYLHVSIHEIQEMLKKHNIILLIDNLTLNDKYDSRIRELEEMVMDKSLKGVRFVATSIPSITGEVPLEFLSNPFISKVKKIKISPFKVKQIRELSAKWFSKKEDALYKMNTNHLISVFSKLNIPRTPLSVSMFLWILESQENYKPINNAFMLENYIEKLFKKHSPEEVYSETFDFSNKQRLLAKIALEMYKTDNDNYNLTRTELYKLTDSYLKSRRLVYKVEDILDQFIKIGILHEEYSNSGIIVSFRFDCFFKYFLMKNMDYDEKFKEFVLSEEKYLLFVDEIEYYTGLKRDQDSILLNVSERMMRNFDEWLSYLFNKTNSYDSIFNHTKLFENSENEHIIEKLSPSHKQSEKEEEELLEFELENGISEKGIVKKETELSYIKVLERSWILTAKVLKNTEETENIALKNQVYENMLNCSVAFASLYKIIIDQYLFKSNETLIVSKEELNMLDKFLPLVHQQLTYRFVGTAKLSLVFEDDVKAKLTDVDNQYSEFEKFISVFIYCDIKGDKFIHYIDQLIRIVKKNYIKEMIFLKLLNIFYTSKTTTYDDEYLKLIGEIKVRINGGSRQKKGEYIEIYRNKKFLSQYNGQEDDKDEVI